MIWRWYSLQIQTRFWRVGFIFKSSLSGLAVGSTWLAGLEFQIVKTSGPPQSPIWKKVPPFISIISCLAIIFMLSPSLFVTPIRRCHMRMALSTCNNWSKPEKKYGRSFFSSWINVIGESMMEWLNNWYPWFICVRLNPPPFENEKHTIACSITSILQR